MRSLPVLALAAALVLGGGVAAAAERSESVVECDRIVLRGGSGSEDGFRILLEAVAVAGPRQVAADTKRTADREWPYFRNGGLAVRAGTSSVVVEVPEGWRDRVALSWGGSRPSSSIRFATCGAVPGGAWNAYAGGFHLRSPRDCVPLHLRIGGRSTTIRVGIGRACGASR